MWNQLQPGEWLVRLSGDPTDLSIVEHHLCGTDFAVLRDGAEVLLRSKVFAGLQDPSAVREAAQPLVNVINAAVWLTDGQTRPVIATTVSRVRPDLKRDQWTLAEAAEMRLVVMPGTALLDGVAQPPKRVLHAIRAAARDPLVAAALGQLRYDSEWGGLYKALESIRADVGGERQLKAKNWAPNSEVRRFRHTANSSQVLGKSARHGATKGTPPSHPMTLQEARALVDRIAQKWIETKPE